MDRQDVYIELLDAGNGLTANPTGTTSNQYILKDAWVCKYTAPDLNALQSEIAIETLEIAFERLEIPGAANNGAS